MVLLLGYEGLLHCHCLSSHEKVNLITNYYDVIETEDLHIISDSTNDNQTRNKFKPNLIWKFFSFQATPPVMSGMNTTAATHHADLLRRYIWALGSSEEQQNQCKKKSVFKGE
jgi:hypothetical protein